MIRLVLNHQQPRIKYYMQTINKALESIECNGKLSEFLERVHPIDQGSSRSHSTKGQLSLDQQLSPRIPDWTDNQGLRYTFSGESHSLSAKTDSNIAEGWSNLDVMATKLDDVLNLAQNLSQGVLFPLSDHQLTDLKRLMETTLDLWRMSHGQVFLTLRIRNLLGNRRKQEREFRESLLFLCRIYYGVEIFAEAAKRLECMQNITMIAVPYHSKEERRYVPNPLAQTLRKLSIRVGVKAAPKFLAKLQKNFDLLREENRRSSHIHAEVQALYHLDILFPKEEKSFSRHSYIGCSKRCCFLCNAFILSVFPNMRFRGTHRQIFHMWELQQYFPLASQQRDFDRGARSMLKLLRGILQRLVDAASPVKSPALAQSSVGLPSLESIMQEELGKMMPSHTQSKYKALARCRSSS